MIRTKEFYKKGFYIFESKVAANSNYIENIQEAKLLLTYAGYYLKDFLKIHDYIITRHGWQLAVCINDQFPNEKIDPWRVISERIRLFISSYVRGVNFRRKRTGVLVHSNYQRFYFETWQEAKDHMESMRNQRIRLYQKKKKYRGLKFHYTIKSRVAKGSIFLCSKERSEGNHRIEREIEHQGLWGLTNLVGPNLIKSTSFLHMNHKNNKKYHHPP